MKNNERIVQFFDVSAIGSSRARDVPEKLLSTKNVPELFSDLNKIRELNLGRQLFQKGIAHEIRLEHMEEKNDYWVLLVNVVDTSAAHPVTIPIGGKDVDRNVVALTNQIGLESSAHIIMYKDADKNGHHLCLFEKNATFSFSRAVSFLNYLLRIALKKYTSEYTIAHPSGAAGKRIKVLSKFRFVGHPSDEFLNELQGGKLTGVYLVSDVQTIKGYDAQKQPELKETHISMSVKTLDILKSGGNWKHIQKAVKYGDQLDSPVVKVSFKDSTGAGRSAVLSTDTAQLVDESRYVKKGKISGFKAPLTTSFGIIQDSIVKKMIELAKG